MFPKNKLVQVPASVQDIAEKLTTERNPDVRVAYLSRLASIRDFCDSIIKKFK